MKEWMAELARCAGMIYKVKSEREEECEARRAGDVLLQPHVLALLPWNTAVLQPWLAAALIIIQQVTIETQIDSTAFSYS